MGIDPRTLPAHLRERLGVSPRNRAAPVTAEAWADARRRAAATRRTRNAAGSPTHPAVPPPDDFAPTLCVGLDPSVADFGWAAVTRTSDDAADRVLASGTWHPRTTHTHHGDTLAQLWAFLGRLLGFDLATNRRDDLLVVLELPGGSSTYAMRGLASHTHGRACGVAYAACLAAGLKVVTPGVREWKGQASKRHTHDQVRLRTGHEPAGDDEADAIGLALWGLDGGWRAGS